MWAVKRKEIVSTLLRERADMLWCAGNRCRKSRCKYTLVAQHCWLLNKCLFYC